MVGISCEQNWVSSSSNLEEETQLKVSNFDQDEGTQLKVSNFNEDEGVFDQERDEIWKKVSENSKKSFTNFNSNSRSNSSSNKKKKNQVLLEGYVEIANNENEDDLKKTKSLTDDDLDELKGCLDLGFGFSYDEIPELCNTLPALELCYSMSQKFLLDDQNKSPDRSSSSPTVADSAAASSPIANWKISSPGDHPEDVKARLKFWAQAVACTVRLCS